MFAGSAHAQKVISDYDPATSIARTDKLLLQQGGATTPYTYGTPAQLFGAMDAQDVSTALNFTPLPSSGGTISGNLTVAGLLTAGSLSLSAIAGPFQVSGNLTVTGLTTLSGGVVATTLPISCSGKVPGTLWNNGNVLSICP